MTPALKPSLDCVVNGSNELADLVHKIRAGNERAIAELYTRLLPGMKIYLKRRIGLDYEDALQESFLTLLNAINTGTLQDPNAVRAFLCTVMLRTCKIAYRDPRQLQLDLTHDRIGSTKTVASIYTEFERAAQKRSMIDALDRIPARMRVVIEKTFLDGKSNEQAMAELGLNETQFRLLKSRAKARLAQEVQRAQSLQALKKSVSSERGMQLRPVAIFG